MMSTVTAMAKPTAPDPSKIVLYPNPSDGSGFSLNIDSDEFINPAMGLSIVVTDMNGHRLLSKNLGKTADGTYVVNFDQNLKQGIYVVTINNKVVRKLIVR